MLDQIVGMVLFGLGLQTPHGSAVLGDTKDFTEVVSRSDDKRIDSKQFKADVEKRRHQGETDSSTRREEFQKKIAQLKDDHKKEILSRLNTKINEINKKRTDALTLRLNKISEIIDKIIQRLEKIKAAGKDTSSAQSHLKTCKSDVTAAQAAISSQAGKQYVISISSENNAKIDAGATLQQLEKDIKSVQEKVKSARKCVSDTFKLFGEMNKNKQDKE